MGDLFPPPLLVPSTACRLVFLAARSARPDGYSTVNAPNVSRVHLSPSRGKPSTLLPRHPQRFFARLARALAARTTRASSFRHQTSRESKTKTKAAPNRNHMRWRRGCNQRSKVRGDRRFFARAVLFCRLVILFLLWGRSVTGSNRQPLRGAIP